LLLTRTSDIYRFFMFLEDRIWWPDTKGLLVLLNSYWRANFKVFNPLWSLKWLMMWSQSSSMHLTSHLSLKFK